VPGSRALAVGKIKGVLCTSPASSVCTAAERSSEDGSVGVDRQSATANRRTRARQ